MWHRAGSLLLAAALAACSLGPPPAGPEIMPAAAWGVGPAPVDPAQWPPAGWWRGIGSPELDRLIEAARGGNHDLAAAYARTLQATAQLRIAGAALSPEVEAGGSAGRTRSNSRTSSSYQTLLTASYQIDLFGGNAALRDAAQARLAASRYDREALALSIDAGVVLGFFRLLALRDRIRLSEGTLEIARSVLDLLEQRRAIGVSTELEVARQRNVLASQLAALEVLRQAEREALSGLALLLGRAPMGFAVEAQSLADLSLLTVTAGIPSGLLLRRPDVRAAESVLAAAGLDVVVARADRLPAITLTGRGGLLSGELSSLVQSQSLLYGATASVAQTIFDAGRLAAREDLARARHQELSELYRRVADEALADVVDALNATGTTARQHEFAYEAYVQAGEAFRIVEARYREGTGQFLDLLDAQRAVFQANDALVQAVLARFSALVALYSALGGGWGGEAG